MANKYTTLNTATLFTLLYKVVQGHLVSLEQLGPQADLLPIEPPLLFTCCKFMKSLLDLSDVKRYERMRLKQLKSCRQTQPWSRPELVAKWLN